MIYSFFLEAQGGATTLGRDRCYFFSFVFDFWFQLSRHLHTSSGSFGFWFLKSITIILYFHLLLLSYRLKRYIRLHYSNSTFDNGHYTKIRVLPAEGKAGGQITRKSLSILWRGTSGFSWAFSSLTTGSTGTHHDYDENGFPSPNACSRRIW